MATGVDGGGATSGGLVEATIWGGEALPVLAGEADVAPAAATFVCADDAVLAAGAVDDGASIEGVADRVSDVVGEAMARGAVSIDAAGELTTTLRVDGADASPAGATT